MTSNPTGRFCRSGKTDQYPELAYLSTFYEGINLYGSWEFGRSAGIRGAQRSDVRPSPLTENLSNLGMFLNRLAPYPAARARLTAHLTELYEGITDFELYFDPSSVQLLFTEGDYSIPASRLSDGSLRYLFLLAALLDPEPPKFLGIEEPELGLHPDLLPKLAALLVDASSRCQLVVTTHSDLLVDALSEHPESVVVCEKHDGRTSMRRLDRSDLTRWLERVRAGAALDQGEAGWCALVRAEIYVEGGGPPGKLTNIRCRAGFRKLLANRPRRAAARERRHRSRRTSTDLTATVVRSS